MVHLKKGKSPEEMYASMHSEQLIKVLAAKKNELKDYAVKLQIATQLRNTLNDYLVYKPFHPEYLNTLDDVDADIRFYKCLIKFHSNLIRVIKALIALKTGK